MSDLSPRRATLRLPFDPAQRRARHDGWSAERQIAFVEALAETACVTEAAAHVGVSVGSAYRLKRDPRAAAFRAAWDAALDQGIDRLDDAVLGRAVHGVARPVFYKGEQIGERRHHDERLALFLLRYRRPERYGAALDQFVGMPAADPVVALADRLAALEGKGPAAAPIAQPHPGTPRPATPRYVPRDRYATIAAGEEEAQAQARDGDAKAKLDQIFRDMKERLSGQGDFEPDVP